MFENLTPLLYGIAMLLAVGMMVERIRTFVIDLVFSNDFWIFLIRVYIERNPEKLAASKELIKEIKKALYASSNDFGNTQQINMSRIAQALTEELKHAIKQIDANLIRACMYFESNGEHSQRGFSIRKLNMAAESIHHEFNTGVPHISDIMQSIPIEHMAYRYEKLRAHEPVLISLETAAQDKTELTYLDNALRQRLLSYHVKELIVLLITDIDGYPLALIELQFGGLSYSKINSIKDTLSNWVISVERELS